MPWWSDPGPESCEFCRRAFHIEVGFFCADCDRPICPVCVTRIQISRTVSCPECHDEERG